MLRLFNNLFQVLHTILGIKQNISFKSQIMIKREKSPSSVKLVMGGFKALFAQNLFAKSRTPKILFKLRKKCSIKISNIKCNKISKLHWAVQHILNSVLHLTDPNWSLFSASSSSVRFQHGNDLFVATETSPKFSKEQLDYSSNCHSNYTNRTLVMKSSNNNTKKSDYES